MRFALGAGLLLTVVVACSSCGDDDLRPVADPARPSSDDPWDLVPADAAASELQALVEAGVASRGAAADPGGADAAARQSAGRDSVRFIVIRAGDRHGTDYRPEAFHAVVGAGVTLPPGSLRIRRDWNTGGMVDGNNEFPQVHGIAVAVEPQAPRPYAREVKAAVKRFVEAVASVAPVHPDCVVAMGEIPYTNLHEADVDERTLAAAAREGVPLPPVDGRLTIHAESGPLVVAYERRDTTRGIAVGMMLRRGFDGENRGMLFVYPHADYKYFWMFNCLTPIDVCHIGTDGRIDSIHPMQVEVDPLRRPRTEEWARAQSSGAVKHVLEMPYGWFERHGVKTGDRVDLE